MNKLLLEKIEELTLYILEQEKQLNELSSIKEEMNTLKILIHECRK
ncbi:MAG: hypothetical protein AAGA86_00095 [Bacteroidota bacterium]